MTTTDVKQLLINAGFPDNSIMFAVAQACFESGGTSFDSAVDLENNNLTGIVFANASWQKNCVKGTAKPAGEEVGYYAHFNTLADWALDFHRIVHAQFTSEMMGVGWNDEGRPIDATDITTYVHRLKLNHYFEGDEADYLAGLQRYYNELMGAA